MAVGIGKQVLHPVLSDGTRPKKAKLDSRLAKLLSLICNASSFKKQQFRLGFGGNADKGDLIEEKDLSVPKDSLLYSYYEQHGCRLRPVEVDSNEYSMIKLYMQNTTNTDASHNIRIEQIFRASREVEGVRFKKFSSNKNRMLLWHGSRLTNWLGILTQGLRIAPQEAELTGQSFGKGIYFADMFSTSLEYCHLNSTARDGILLLCEVALGDTLELLNYNTDAHNLPQGKQSVKGVGRVVPDPSESLVLEDGLVVPLGKPIEQEPKAICSQNEFVVFDVHQIRMRYVVHVRYEDADRDVC